MQQAQQKNVYVFIVEPRTNKDQIRHEVETIFGVKVESVRTMMEPTRVHKTGKRRTVTNIPPKKKAYVKLQAGQKIDLFDVITQQPE